jgi:sterol desaturase/sphingolipid hydroxylase (fatty acid hydroxylase superfamily)
MTLKKVIKTIYFSGFQNLTTLFILIIWLKYNGTTDWLNSILVGSLSIIMMLLEWKFPNKNTWKLTKNEFKKDMFYQIGVYFLYGPLMLNVAGQFFIGCLGKNLQFYQLALWPTHWPLVFKISLALIIIEFFNYWFHRAEHFFSWLWPLHSVHHSPNKMGWSKMAVNHPIEYFILVAIGVLPAALFGAETRELEGAVLIYLTTTMFAHCNLKLNDHFLFHLFTNNTYHYRHHSPILKESLSNYGCALVIWDKIFGTYKGIEFCDKVGIEPGRDYNLMEELMLPFKTMKIGIGP